MNNSLFANRGLALIVVLWITLLVSMLLSGIILHTSVEIQQAANSKDNVFGDIAITNAMENIKYKISTQEIKNINDIVNLKLKFNGYTVTITKMVDESAKIDINTFSYEKIYLSLLSLGISKEESEIISAQIIDWRDKDSIVSLHGAEKIEYLRLKLPPPANREFYSPIELLNLPAIKTKGNQFLDFFTVIGRGYDFYMNNENENIQNTSNNIVGKIYTLEFTAKRSNSTALKLTYTVLMTGLEYRPMDILRVQSSL